MATDEVGLCNAALRMLGEKAILSLTDNTIPAQLCNQFYAETRDECLTLNPWNFAQKRVALQQNVTTPVWEFDYAYTLPSDCLQVQRMLDEDNYDYKIEEDNLVTDDGTCKIKYTAQITDVAKFPEWFKRLLVAALAVKLSIPLMDSGSTLDRMERRYERAEFDAFSADAQEGTPETLEYDDLIDVR